MKPLNKMNDITTRCNILSTFSVLKQGSETTSKNVTPIIHADYFKWPKLKKMLNFSSELLLHKRNYNQNTWPIIPNITVKRVVQKFWFHFGGKMASDHFPRIRFKEQKANETGKPSDWMEPDEVFWVAENHSAFEWLKNWTI